jgi:hypothetical protein
MHYLLLLTVPLIGGDEIINSPQGDEVTSDKISGNKITDGEIIYLHKPERKLALDWKSRKECSLSLCTRFSSPHETGTYCAYEVVEASYSI